MNIQRLKFAWARGARIETAYCAYPDKPVFWEELADFPGEPAPLHIYRIHPDDAHLEYGPLSTALRETAAGLKTHPGFHSSTGWVVVLFPELADEWWDLNGDARRMQFLFLAELLADEGH